MTPEQRTTAELWAAGARDALDTAEKLHTVKKHDHALFFCHRAVEKALKSKYIVETNQLPPYTHDIVLLEERLTTSLTDDLREALTEINTFSVAGRYAEEKLELYKRATPEYAERWLATPKNILHTLLS